MRFRIALLTTAVLMTALMFPSLAHLKENKATQAASPAAGVFRVVLNGFRVNHESDDDILEGDGKRDEVYLRADVWVLNRDGSVSYRRSPRSVLMGDINNQSDPPRIRAGTASDMGGLRTNDTWPINEPWRRVRNPLPDRPPMLLWEGQLSRGENMAVIIPTVWEWDSRDPSPSEIYWDDDSVVAQANSSGRNPNSSEPGFFATHKPDFLDRLAGNSPIGYSPPARPGRFNDVLEFPHLDAEAGTRPVGADVAYMRPCILTLTYDAAIEAVRRSPANLGFGVFALNYADFRAHGDYTLYVQVEQIK